MRDIDKMRRADLHNNALLLREKSGVEFYLKENSSFVDIDCPVCLNKEGSEISFYKYGFKHLICNTCDTLYVSPRPTEDKLFDYYNNYEAPIFWNNLLVETNSDRKYLQCVPRANMLKDILFDSSNDRDIFVDLGAGNGNFSKGCARTKYI